MKKRLVTILSLIMAFVLCFSLAACGNDDSSHTVKKPQSTDKAVTVSLNDALDAVNGVLNAEGFTGTASYSLSTKNTETLTERVTLDKRGSKIKITSNANETVIDLQTGYAYYKYGDYYAYDNEFFANAYGYTQYLLASLKQQAPEQTLDARYDAKAKTVTFTVEKADSVNKYIEPLISAYQNNKTVGSLLNEYCKLLFGKSFDAMYNVFEAYVSDPQNTVGTLLDLLKEKGLDVEAILEMFDIGLPAEQMAAVKARPLNKVIAGACNYLKENFKDFIPFAQYDGDDQTNNGDDQTETGGMSTLGEGLKNAALFDEISDEDVTKGMQIFGFAVLFVKEATVPATIDMALKDKADVADLYTVIKNGVKLKNLTTTLTLTVDDDQVITGAKLDQLASHTYNGVAAEGSLLADNDYRTTAEIVIDEYAAPTEDFVIACDPEETYKTSIVSLIYDVTDSDVSVYYEVGGKAVTVRNYSLYWITPSGETREILPENESAFRFDAATSSFVFDKGLIHDAFSDEAFRSYINAGFSVFGTKLCAVVYFDDDEDGYEIVLQYVNDDWEQIYDYAYNSAMDMIMGFVGGAGAPQPPEGSDIGIAQ